MDSYELNKIAGAVLGTLLFVMIVSFAAETIFHRDEPELAGFEIEVPEDGAVVAEAEPEEVVPLPVLLAAASAADGESAVRKCAACHSFDKGGANKVGPNLWDVVNGPKAHVDDFRYSNALAEAGDNGEVWGVDELNGFLENPRGYLSGTSMAFAGVRSPEERADIIVYLNSLSDSPDPLPAAE